MRVGCNSCSRYHLNFIGMYQGSLGNKEVVRTLETKEETLYGRKWIAFDWSFGILASFTMLLYIGLFVLAIYLMISTIRFFKHKTKHDKELLLKLDELIIVKSQN